jgi:hypothetical protein
MRPYSRPLTESIELLASLNRASERREEAIREFCAADDDYGQSLLQVRDGTPGVYDACARAFQKRLTTLDALVAAHESARAAARRYRQSAGIVRRGISALHSGGETH